MSFPTSPSPSTTNKSLPPLPLADIVDNSTQRKERVINTDMRVEDFGYNSSLTQLFSEPFVNTPREMQTFNTMHTLSDRPISPSSPSTAFLSRPSTSQAQSDRMKSKPGNDDTEGLNSPSVSSLHSKTNSFSSTSTPRARRVNFNEGMNSSTFSFRSQIPTASSSVDQFGVSRTPLSASVSTSRSAPGEMTRKKSTSRLLVSNLGRGLTRVGTVMKRGMSESSINNDSRLNLSIRSRSGRNGPKSPDGDGGEASGWMKRRARSSTLPEYQEGREELQEWETSTMRRHVDTEGDGDITRPFNVEHALHVSQDLADLPPAWLEALRSQGLSESDLHLIQAAKRNADERTKASLRPVRTSHSTPPQAMELPSPIGYTRRKSSTTPKLSDAKVLPDGGVLPVMRNYSHGRRPSFFERFDFEKDEDDEETNGPATSGEPHPSGTPTSTTPPPSSGLMTPSLSTSSSLSKFLSNSSLLPSPPTRQYYTRPSPFDTPNAASRKHKKRLSEQLKGFQSTFRNLDDDDDWAGNLTAALDKGFGDLLSPLPESAGSEGPDITSETIEPQSQIQATSGVTLASELVLDEHRNTALRNTEEQSGTFITRTWEEPTGARPWPHSPPPPPRRKPVANTSSSRSDVSMSRTASSSSQAFNDPSTFLASVTTREGGHHTRNASEALSTGDEADIVTPPPRASRPGTEYLGDTPTSDTFSKLYDRYNDPIVGKSLTSPYIGLSLTPFIPFDSHRNPHLSLPASAVTSDISPPSRSLTPDLITPPSYYIDEGAQLIRITSQDGSLHIDRESMFRFPSNMSSRSHSKDRLSTISTSNKRYSISTRRKPVPSFPSLPPGAAEPRISRDLASVSSPRHSLTFITPLASPSQTNYLRSRFTPASPSSVGHSRPTSLDSAIHAYVPHPTLGEAFSIHSRGLSQSTNGGDALSEAHDRASLAYSMLSSRNSTGSNSVHEATVQRAVSMMMASNMGLGLGKLGEDDDCKSGEGRAAAELTNCENCEKEGRGLDGVEKGNRKGEEPNHRGSSHVRARGSTRSRRGGKDGTRAGIGQGTSPDTEESDLDNFPDSVSSSSAIFALEEAARAMMLDRLGVHQAGGSGGRDRDRGLSGVSRFEDAD